MFSLGKENRNLQLYAENPPRGTFAWIRTEELSPQFNWKFSSCGRENRKGPQENIMQYILSQLFSGAWDEKGKDLLLYQLKMGLTKAIEYTTNSVLNK